MHSFKYKNDILYCEKVSVKDLADKYSTPLFIYSSETVLDHFIKIKKAFAPVKPLICYSVKANSNLSILDLMVSRGGGLDIVSGGELFRAKKVKCPAKKIVYASVGKTNKEIRDAINYGILMFNVESLAELILINKIAKSLKRKVDVALRINPDIEPKTHNYIITGKKETKFGMDIEAVKKAILNSKDYPYLNLVGLHVHIGSQIIDSEPFVKAIKKVEVMINQLKEKGIVLKYINIGGGLGIVYDKEKAQTVANFAKKVVPLLKRIGLKVILEPGRFIVGNAGILVTKVTYIKDTPVKSFVIVDAAMNDLIRPSLYEAYHNISTLKLNKKSKIKKVDVVGPVCESADFLGKDRMLRVDESDHIVVFSAGAYGFSMSSNYNSRPRAAEVLVRGTKADVVRKRETYEDLVSKEKVLR